MEARRRPGAEAGHWLGMEAWGGVGGEPGAGRRAGALEAGGEAEAAALARLALEGELAAERARQCAGELQRVLERAGIGRGGRGQRRGELLLLLEGDAGARV